MEPRLLFITSVNKLPVGYYLDACFPLDMLINISSATSSVTSSARPPG
jgi:hypothetical protein